MKTKFIISSLFLLPLNVAAIENPLAPQTAEYLVDYGSINLGKARYQLSPPEDNVYNYRFDSDLSLLMLSDKRTLKSTFSYDGTRLTPMRYTHNRSGTGPDFQEQAAFVIDQKLVHSRYKDERAKFPYTEDLYDPLVAQLQFRLDISAGAKTLHYKMVKSGELDDYDFKVLGKEKVTIESGTYDTVKIEVVRDNTKRQTFFWMSPELAYLPIRLTHFEKGSKQLDIKLLNYQFSAVEDAVNTESTKQTQEQAESTAPENQSVTEAANKDEQPEPK
ncbi:DUF3108 domain-containing protein [Shewanella sp. Isolate11]|uniref:DUF3108 domain-containing protein n=1 Tax=Shewanella sp. Isolate11 TaxID=2908530 RepID=UPI001EFD07A1|nr:DUF3108 domain-containing protein [Shewanella sp. Isolate11]MCG9696553.1 DUF3108 domain-containing protein [Shewanella sp. Isolate11]